jgi:hypothetical protein
MGGRNTGRMRSDDRKRLAYQKTSRKTSTRKIEITTGRRQAPGR